MATFIVEARRGGAVIASVTIEAIDHEEAREIGSEYLPRIPAVVRIVRADDRREISRP